MKQKFLEGLTPSIQSSLENLEFVWRLSRTLPDGPETMSEECRKKTSELLLTHLVVVGAPYLYAGVPPKELARKVHTLFIKSPCNFHLPYSGLSELYEFLDKEIHS